MTQSKALEYNQALNTVATRLGQWKFDNLMIGGTGQISSFDSAMTLAIVYELDFANTKKELNRTIDAVARDLLKEQMKKPA